MVDQTSKPEQSVPEEQAILTPPENDAAAVEADAQIEASSAETLATTEASQTDIAEVHDDASPEESSQPISDLAEKESSDELSESRQTSSEPVVAATATAAETTPADSESPAAEEKEAAPVAESSQEAAEATAKEELPSTSASEEAATTQPPQEVAEPVVATELTWGFIDTENRIHQRTTPHFRGRSIGVAVGESPPQIAEFEANFAPLLKDVEALDAEIATAKNKVAVMGRIRRMKSTAGKAQALGDFEDLFCRLADLETMVQTEIMVRRAMKEALIAEAESLKNSTDWRVTGDAYKALFADWKKVGATGREADDALWGRFIDARETFNKARGAHFEQRREQWDQNRLLKQELIIKALELSTSTEWRETSRAMRDVFAEWKTVGSAGRKSDDELWKQFREGQQVFYDRRAAFWEENKAQKELFCQRAEEASANPDDWESTVEEMKSLMAQWKTVGPTGKREVDDALWERFRGAQNAFFERRKKVATTRENVSREAVQGKERLVASIEALGYSPDPVAAAEEATKLKAEFDSLPPARKDRDEVLNRRARKALGDIRVNAAAEGARRAVSWEGKLRQALERSQVQMENLEQTVSDQEIQLTSLESSLASANEEEKPALQEEIEGLRKSLDVNRSEVERLRDSTTEVGKSLEP